MRSSFFNRVGLLSLVVATLASGGLFDSTASGQECPITFPASPGNVLTSYLTSFPGYTGPTDPIVSTLVTVVTNVVNHTNYLSNPIAYGTYRTWCIDEWNEITPTQVTVPGSTIYTGSLYSSCDPNLNLELTPGHRNTLVSPATWQMVNYILNHKTYNNTNAFYWDVQTAINTLVGSATGSTNTGYACSDNIVPSPTPSGCGYPTNHPVVVQSLLTDAELNAATWVPQCGDVYGVLYVTLPLTNQILLLEVPVCSAGISVSKEIACVQPTMDCTVFTKTDTGYVGTNEPGFCYKITITNSGEIPLTNVTVVDTLLGTLSARFPNFLAPGGTATAFYTMPFASDATNSVTVTGYAYLAQPVTNGDTIITNNTPYTSTDTAIAIVQPVSISCSLSLYSDLDLYNHTNASAILLPTATIYSTPPLVSFTLTVYNNSSAALTNVTISSYALTKLGCTMPAPFNMPPNSSTNFTAFCVETVTCPGETLSVNVVGYVMPGGGNACGVYDSTSTNLIAAVSACMGTVTCQTGVPNNGPGCTDGTASLYGHVYLHCDANTPVVGTDKPAVGLAVSLLNASSVLVASTSTDANGFYTFTGMAAGTYTVQVIPPANYSQTYPNGSSSGQVTFTVVACQNLEEDFGYADHSPIGVMIPPGSDLGCNPTTLPSVASVQANSSATNDLGALPVVVTLAPLTTNGCTVTMVFTATATNSCGDINTTNATYTFTVNAAPLVLGNVPAGGSYGCNPTALPTDFTATNGVTVSPLCSATLVTFGVTNVDVPNACGVTRTYTITATDSCGNTGTATVVYTWTINSAPLVLANVPGGSDYGCNPTTLPTDFNATNGVTVTLLCAATLTGFSDTYADVPNICGVTRTYTITATDSCGNTGSATVVYTWTINTAPLVLVNVPAGGDYGCNPTTLPTDFNATNGVTVNLLCNATLVSFTDTYADVPNPCGVTRTYTITATDSCGNSGTATVVYTWTINSAALVLANVPAGGNFGCNPTTLPTDFNATNGVTVTLLCNATLTSFTDTYADLPNPCGVTRTYTITATDSCGNSGTATVVYTWTLNSLPLVLANVPAGIAYGCNPTALPTDSTATNGVTVNLLCSASLVSFGVIHSDIPTGCSVTRTYTITATDTCGNTGTATVVYSWTIDTTAPVIHGIPTTGLALGCNPTALPTVASITALLSATDNCAGTPAIVVTCADAISGCVTTRTFSITATDTCGNHASGSVAYTWTVDTTAPVISGVPTTGLALGCNPTTLPTVASITALLSATDNCAGTPAIVVTCADAISGCVTTRTFSITATDTCGNHASGSVAYTWTVDTTAPVISGIPTTGLALGCNPTTLPTVASITALLSATDNCAGTPAIVVTCADATSGCVTTRTFSITATDTCGNHASGSVAYTWTVDTTAPVIHGVPTTGLALGCNPTTLPTVASITALLSATDNCAGTPAIVVTCADAISGCVTTRTFSITATDTCGNHASASVAYYWTLDTVPPVLTLPTTGLALGCNPSTLPTVASVTGLVHATDNCSTPTILITTNADSITGCVTTRTFVATATDSCGNHVSGTFAYTWTVDTTPPVLTVPTNSNLGCNPTTFPSTSSVTALVHATDNCGTPIITVATNGDTTTSCVTTRTFIVTATDSCGNHVSANVVYTWTVDTTPPVITGVPTNANLGMNPAALPTITSISNMIHVTDACGDIPTVRVTNVLSTNVCTTTSTFTITATDQCNNHTTATVVYTWTSDTGPIVTCPPDFTYATNFTPLYCTFAPSDWCSPCNGAGSTPTWWTAWDQQNNAYNCMPSWTNWWSAWTGVNPGNSCWSFCQNQQPGDNYGYWWGGSCNQSSAPSWCFSWNYGNPNNNVWVPCGGLNPASVLTNCFSRVYSNGCVRIGLTNGSGYCVKLTNCNAIWTCLKSTGTANPFNCSATNPNNSCNSGNFCAQVLSLQLNCDFGDAGAVSGCGGPCGDLIYNDTTSPCNGWKVRDICKTANCVLGGGSAPSGCTASYLCGLCSNLNTCFQGCQVSSWCHTHLTPVYVPPPAVSGTATVTGSACSVAPVLSYCDSVTTGVCPGAFVIDRTWTAVDAAGMSNYCTQVITITQNPAPSISGSILNDCVGLGCSSHTPNLSSAAGITGVTVTLKSSSGLTLASTVTDTNGDFSFAHPGAGTYTVVVTPPAGYTLTYPSTGTANQESVTLASACQFDTNVIFSYMGNQTAVQLIKTGPTNATCGQSITYTFAVTNTGNNCVELSVVDPLLGGTIFDQTGVAPGQGFIFSRNYAVVSTNLGSLTNTAWGIANPASGPNVTNTSKVVTAVTTPTVNCSVTSGFNSQMPASGWMWCNAHISAQPNQQCDIHCQGATITITGNSGKVYTYPVPDCDIVFTNNCTVATNYFDGTKWHTILPVAGDDGIFLAGCAIPCNADFANSHTVCWQGNFSCNVSQASFNWQWGAACYNNTQPAYNSCGIKACHQTSCGYNSNGGDQCGTPENEKSHCVGGGTGGGGSNCTGSWSGTGSCMLQSCH